MTRDKIIQACEDVKEMLLAKNEAYGDAALNPIQVFSQLGSSESIKVRIDDKLSRIRNSGLNDKTEDTLMDLIGYLVLLKISEEDIKGAPIVVW